MNSEKQLNRNTQIAQFKLAIISPVIHGLFSDASRAAYYKRVTEKPLTFPDGTQKTYSYKTIEKWVSNYKLHGFDGLLPTSRSDKGVPRVLPDTAIEEIYRIKEKFPRINATQIHHHLVENSFIPDVISVDTVQRFIKKNDLKGARNLNVIDRKAFEEDAFGKMWQADTCYFPYITEDGKQRRVYCVMIIDDHSRMLVGGELFYNDNAENFQKVLHNAISRYCVPTKLYVDNGGPYANAQLALICGALGTVLLHTRVRDGAAKAKIERSWRTIKERLIYKLDPATIPSLEAFNEILANYIREYNVTLHTGINCTPMDRFNNTKANMCAPKSKEWLDECFLNRITRKVRKDATVSIDKHCFDVPMQFIGATVDIRFCPNDLSSAFILYENCRFPLRLTNKVENCRTKRNNPKIDYSKIGGTN